VTLLQWIYRLPTGSGANQETQMHLQSALAKSCHQWIENSRPFPQEGIIYCRPSSMQSYEAYNLTR
jgi:hypothetical protein